jgi:hypothetical protein
MAIGAWGGAGPRADTTELKRWVHEELSLEAGTMVTVSELTSTEPGCPPLETVISVFPDGQDSFLVKVAKPIVEVERIDLVAALAWGGDHL